MATIMMMHWPEVSREQYEKVREIVNWEGDIPSGAKFQSHGSEATGFMFSTSGIRAPSSSSSPGTGCRPASRPRVWRDNRRSSSRRVTRSSRRTRKALVTTGQVGRRRNFFGAFPSYRFRMHSVRAALLLLFAVRVSADPIADVRAALARLTAREAVVRHLRVAEVDRERGEARQREVRGKGDRRAGSRRRGFRIIVPQALLAQIDREREAKIRDPKLNTPTVSALSEIDATKTSDAVDFAPVLLRMLDGAKLVSDAVSTFQGKPARALVLRLVDRLDPDDAGRVKISDTG